jgi:hypothetical protein
MIHSLLQRELAVIVAIISFLAPLAIADEPAGSVKETVTAGPNQVALKVRMEGPYTADVPLQVVCYFKFTPAGAKRMSGAPVELDKDLGGVIASLRERKEFPGEQLETILIVPPDGSIKAQRLLLIGLGDEDHLSLELMEQIGKVAQREASRLGISKVAFAPLIRDQGNTKFETGAVETAVVRGMLLAYDTDRQMQKEKLAKPYTLEEWWIEAGPAYYDETVEGVKTAAKQAESVIKRAKAPYSTKGR